MKRETLAKRGDEFGRGHALGSPGSRYSGTIDFDDDLPRNLSPVIGSDDPEPSNVPQESGPVVVRKSDDTESPGGIPESVHNSLESPGVPPVLTWAAVRKNALEIADDGSVLSGLPQSLEADVPPRFRYWKCETAADALRVREALVESGLFAKDTIRKVDGVPRRVSVERFVTIELPPDYDDDSSPEVPGQRRAIDKAANLLSDSDSETTLFPEDVVGIMGLDSVLEKVSNLEGDWLIAAEFSEEIAKRIEAPVFQIPSRDDLMFVTNAELRDPEAVKWLDVSRTSEVLKNALVKDRVIPILKANDEERLIYGIVLEPGEVDAHNDTVSAEEIRQACHKFMEQFGALGVQHDEMVGGDKLRLLENFIAPVTFKVSGETVKKGSWVMAQRVVDDKLWKGVKSGDFTGYSIGGSAVKKPANKPAK